MKNLLFAAVIFLSSSFTSEKTVKVKLINKCNYDLSVSCPGYSLLVSANSYSNNYLPVGTTISIGKYGNSDSFDKLYLEEKDNEREIIVCR
jgi:hypothetical protein